MSELQILDKAQTLNQQAGLPMPAQEQFMAVEAARAAQEVQAMVVVAKKFPRDVNGSYTRIMEACKRKSLADVAVYAYPRGGQTVSGPSIRMAEVLAQNWGNLNFGIRQLSRTREESVMEAYCWDLETNVRQSRVFSVPHERDTKKGKQHLDDSRDIYELTANQGSRRLRACILGIIPGDVVEAALGQCDQTMQSDAEPLIDRIRKMLVAFQEFGVSKEMLEKRLGHKIEATIEVELVNLKKIFRSLKDGMASRDQFFEIAGSEVGKAKDLNEALKATKEEPKSAVKPKGKVEKEPVLPGQEPMDFASFGAAE